MKRAYQAVHGASIVPEDQIAGVRLFPGSSKPFEGLAKIPQAVQTLNSLICLYKEMSRNPLTLPFGWYTVIKQVIVIQKKERPIIFSGPSVVLIQRGLKIQTRRICKRAIDSLDKVSPFAICPAKETGWIAWFGKPCADIAEFTKKAYNHGFPCPYGVPGDRLWVRETFTLQCDADGDPPPFDDGRPIQRTGNEENGYGWLQPHYKATDPSPALCCEDKRCRRCADGEPSPHWESPLHLPRWASRLLLELTDVRVQRLQEISYNDVLAEGLTHFLTDEAQTDASHIAEAKQAYGELWDKLNAKRGFPWNSNPWVWTLTFKRLAEERTS
jgi:hypothetical protein